MNNLEAQVKKKMKQAEMKIRCNTSLDIIHEMMLLSQEKPPTQTIYKYRMIDPYKQCFRFLNIYCAKLIVYMDIEDTFEHDRRNNSIFGVMDDIEYGSSKTRYDIDDEDDDIDDEDDENPDQPSDHEMLEHLITNGEIK